MLWELLNSRKLPTVRGKGGSAAAAGPRSPWRVQMRRLLIMLILHLGRRGLVSYSGGDFGGWVGFEGLVGFEEVGGFAGAVVEDSAAG